MTKHSVDVVVVGAGPGGYVAAFAAADQGLSVALVDADNRLGGVCLNRGCIPSKALLHIAKLIRENAAVAQHGLSYGDPTIDIDKIREWKESVIEKLSGGIGFMSNKKKITVINGRGLFQSSNTLRVDTSNGQVYVDFKYAIIAVGSRPALPGAFDLGSQRIMTSTEALELKDIPSRLLIVGGGYIGMELGTVYSALGSKVSVVEAQSTILSGADPDLIRPLLKFTQSNFESVMTSTQVKSMKSAKNKVKVTFSDGETTWDDHYDKILVSVGRTPNSQNMGIENTGISVDDRGYIIVNERLQTNEPNIYAIGDIIGGLMLAHKASKEAKIAVENIAGSTTLNTGYTIPAVVFTDPEVAWVGLTETEAKAKNIATKVAKFPWTASGRALTLDRTDGLTKLIIDPSSDRVLGVGIVGAGAGELIAEAGIAIEMGATAEDFANTVHAHPTLSESLMEAAESYYGSAAH